MPNTTDPSPQNHPPPERRGNVAAALSLVERRTLPPLSMIGVPATPEAERLRGHPRHLLPHVREVFWCEYRHLLLRGCLPAVAESAAWDAAMAAPVMPPKVEVRR